MAETNEGQAAEFSQPSGGETPAAPAEQSTPPQAPPKAPAKKAPAKRARAKKATTKRRAPIRAGGHVLDPETNRWVPDLKKGKGK